MELGKISLLLAMNGTWLTNNAGFMVMPNPKLNWLSKEILPNQTSHCQTIGLILHLEIPVASPCCDYET